MISKGKTTLDLIIKDNKCLNRENCINNKLLARVIMSLINIKML